tara:strand:+ start:327 stop:569 length:243 start_codon:yes stop_codon:yes gene_type:complete
MQYMTTLNVWDHSIKKAIENGQIKLQCGQWLRCGTKGKRCRYVGLTSGKSIWVTHWQGSPEKTNADFLNSVEAYNGRQAR